MKGRCPMCGQNGADLTEHHIKELGKDEKGRIPTIGLCGACHESHNKYVNALKAHGFDIDRTK